MRFTIEGSYNQDDQYKLAVMQMANT